MFGGCVVGSGSPRLRPVQLRLPVLLRAPGSSRANWDIGSWARTPPPGFPALWNPRINSSERVEVSTASSRFVWVIIPIISRCFFLCILEVIIHKHVCSSSVLWCRSVCVNECLRRESRISQLEMNENIELCQIQEKSRVQIDASSAPSSPDGRMVVNYLAYALRHYTPDYVC